MALVLLGPNGAPHLHPQLRQVPVAQWDAYLDGRLKDWLTAYLDRMQALIGEPK